MQRRVRYGAEALLPYSPVSEWHVASLDDERKKREPKTRPGLRDLPAHLPRRTAVHTPQGQCGCAACGGNLVSVASTPY